MNILLVTSVYPSATDKNENVTKVVRYFAQDWAKQGHTVRVIHNAHRYPAPVHLLPEGVKRALAARISFYIPSLGDVQPMQYDDGPVKVWRLPITKYIPHGEPPRGAITAQVEKIRTILTEENFTPDIIMGHWCSPQLQIISGLKAIYGCKTSLVLHGRGYFDDPKSDCGKYLSDIDRLGCRSLTEAKYAQTVLGMEKMPFVCYSGVPDAFVEGRDYDAEKFSTAPKTWRFIYVGRLVAYKHVDKVLLALSKLQKDFVFDIIGTGGEEENLKKLAAELGIADKVVFHGRLPREQVLDYMKKAHAFVMISKGEVFGLVYLEAMAASCVTVGSVGEGIDGVIRHGENGLLCTPAEEDALGQTLTELMDASAQTLTSISRAGFETARKFTDSNVARQYLQDACGEETA